MLGCGDGPASFNAEATRRGHHVISFDPISRFGREEIRQRIAVTSDQVLAQTRRNAHEFVWGSPIRDVEELGRVRHAAMDTFLEDYEAGRRAGRYLEAALPALPFADRSFGLAVCSHLLFLYSAHLDESFHRAGLRELCRVADEVRVFPLLTLDGARSPFVDGCIRSCREAGLQADVERVAYEFQRGGNEMLRIGRGGDSLTPS
jgi:hypothetical protein